MTDYPFTKDRLDVLANFIFSVDTNKQGTCIIKIGFGTSESDAQRLKDALVRGKFD